MAALALGSRSLLPAVRPFAFKSLFAGVGIPVASAAAAISQPFQWSIPSLQSLLELFPPFLLAVPKKKVSHSRKAMRSANKGLQDKRNLVHCPGCGSAKLAHHLCPTCYSSLSRGWKAEAKGKQEGPGSS